jgi:phosphonate transport system permease protein
MLTKLSKRALIFDTVIFGGLLTGLGFAVTQPSRAILLNLNIWLAISAAAVFAGAISAFALARSGIKTLGGTIFESDASKSSHAPESMFMTFWGWQFLVAFFVTLFVGLKVTDFSVYELSSAQGFAGARRIFTALITPNFEILPQAILAIIETIFIAFTATVFAIPVAFLVAFFCAKNIVGHHPIGFAVYTILRTGLNVTRSIEPMIWAIIFSVWVGIGPFAGMLALMLHSIASLTKQYSEIIECVNEHPIEGIQATGANPVQVVWYAVVPQIILPYVSFTIYRWDINVRMATVIGLVGGGGIGTMLIQYQGQALWAEVGCIVVVIAVVVWLLDTSSAYIREALK